MSEYLNLSKDGVSYRIWNGERRKQYKIKKGILNSEGVKVSDKFVAYSKTDSTDFAVFDTFEQAEDYFYDDEPIEIIWSKLRIYTKVEPGTTLGNIIDAITKDENFAFIVKTLFPGADFELKKDAASPSTKVSRSIEINSDGHLRLNYSYDHISSQNSLFTFEELAQISIEGKVVAEQRMGWTLLEILGWIFGNTLPKLTLTKEGLRTENGNLPSGELASHLLNNVTFADDLTLSDVFNFVSSDELLTAFLSMYSWCGGIDEIHKAAKLPKPEAIEDPLDYLQIYTDLESHLDKKKYPGWIFYGYDFQGIGPIHASTKKHYELMPEQMPAFDEYGVSLSPMAELAHLPIKLDANLDALIYDENGIKLSIPCKRQYTLLDALDAIYWEISFYGDPEESEGIKNETIASMVEAVEQWEENPEKFRNFSELINRVKAENKIDDEED